MTQFPEVYKVFQMLCDHVGCKPMHVADALEMQPGTLKRSMTNNPSVRLMTRVAWALAIDRHWLLFPPETLEKSMRVMIQIRKDCPALLVKEARDAAPRGGRASRKMKVRKEGKKALEGMYPPQAIKSEEVLDTRFIPYSNPVTPPKEISPVVWERRRKELSVGLPEHLVMTDAGVQAGFSAKDYLARSWTLEALSTEGLICDKRQLGGE
jgi:hypothetical protein